MAADPNSDPNCKGFHFQAVKAHLTYKTHLELDDLRDVIGRETKILSVVHEVGDKNEDEPMPYEHTHVFVWWKKKFQTRDVRHFDIDGIHPNIQTKRSIVWAKHICTKYHLGHKTKACGKKYYIKPIWLHQEGVEEWKFQEDLISTIRAAPTLVDALLDTDIQPKSIADVKMLRAENKRKRAEPGEECDRNKFVKLDWDRKKALVLQGPPGIGKTNWSLAQFENPQLICDLDDLKHLPGDCDGLVFDEMIFFNTSKKTQTFLCDLAFDRTIRTRNTNAMIPKNTPRIFCCNLGEEVFNMAEYDNLERRVTKLFRVDPLWADSSTQ